jgi:hypothetical protein
MRLFCRHRYARRETAWLSGGGHKANVNEQARISCPEPVQELMAYLQASHPYPGDLRPFCPLSHQFEM